MVKKVLLCEEALPENAQISFDETDAAGGNYVTGNT